MSDAPEQGPTSRPLPRLQIDNGRSGVHLWVADPDHELGEVFVEQRYRIPFELTRFEAVAGGWQLDTDLAPVLRFEYKIRVRRGSDGQDETTDNDPLNPDQTATAFGPISVLHRADYLAPSWLGADSSGWVRQSLAVHRDGLGAEIPVEVLSPPGLDDEESAPLLLAHDGAEMDRLASLGTYAAWMLERVGPFRLALVSPVHRDRWYGASDIYADALVEDVLPAIDDVAPTAGRPVGLGASLGALSLCHIQRRHPEAFSGLALQSGSFFTPTLDHQERGYSRFARISTFVEHLSDGTLPAAPIPVAIMCGIAEENFENNQRMQGVLRRQGYPTSWTPFPDAHNFIGWRDCWDPALTELLEQCFAGLGHHDLRAGPDRMPA